jgi:predicted  nucleic acid-binding Zn-ribbon protein
MSSRSALPPRVRDELDAIDAATRALTQAAREGDANAIESNLARRGEAIERLEKLIVELRRESRSAEALLADEARALDKSARGAEQEIHSLLARARKALDAWSTERAAIRTYGVSEHPTVLNRTG